MDSFCGSPDAVTLKNGNLFFAQCHINCLTEDCDVTSDCQRACDSTPLCRTVNVDAGSCYLSMPTATDCASIDADIFRDQSWTYVRNKGTDDTVDHSCRYMMGVSGSEDFARYTCWCREGAPASPAPTPLSADDDDDDDQGVRDGGCLRLNSPSRRYSSSRSSFGHGSGDGADWTMRSRSYATWTIRTRCSCWSSTENNPVFSCPSHRLSVRMIFPHSPRTRATVSSTPFVGATPRACRLDRVRPLGSPSSRSRPKRSRWGTLRA